MISTNKISLRYYTDEIQKSNSNKNLYERRRFSFLRAHGILKKVS